MTDIDIVDAIAIRQGLARAPLFRAGEIERPEDHTVWLDGRDGSFVLSESGRHETAEAASWAWSAGMPHHIGVVGDTVNVLRWDAPTTPERFGRREVVERPNAFFEHLRSDRVRSTRNIVRHCLTTFRKLRNLAHHHGVDDERSVDAYLALLARLCAPPEADVGAIDVATQFDLPEGASALLDHLPATEVRAIVAGFRSFGADGTDIKALPILAIRHASGEVFQEAHFDLVSRPGPDLFGDTPPAMGRKPSRGGVHFTPPYIARSLAEEAIHRLGDLAGRPELVVMDIACGSGAFLVECLRALERKAYAGRVRVVGRDVSASAVSMARFVLGIAVREWPGADRSSTDVRVGDALHDPLPQADVIVLNPPFVVGQDLEPERREQLRGLLSLKKGHLDLSMGFVALAVRCLRPGGAMAALMPAKLLEADGAAAWRRDLTEGVGVALTAVFSDVDLFEHAIVRVGALVVVRGDVNAATVDIKTGMGRGVVGDALRAARRTVGEPAGATVDSAWSVRKGAPARRAEADAIADRARPDPVATAVTDLFDLRMGVRTGDNDVFVRSDAELARLPAAERPYYHPAVTSRGIRDGRVTHHVHVFHPFRDGKPAFEREDQLRDAVPTTYARHLASARAALAKRDGRTVRWWEPSFSAPLLARTPPVLISKYFSSPGGFTVDSTGRCTVLQGFGWVPKDDLADEMAPSRDGRSGELTAAYVAVLNSRAFFDEVARAAPAVAGGQRDMSPRHLRYVPLFDLTRYPEAVPDLAGFGRARWLGEEARSDRAWAEPDVESWTAEKLAQARTGRVFPARQVASPDDLPEWVGWLVRGPETDAPAARYVDVIEHLQNLGMGKDVSEVDDVLRLADAGRMSEESIITLARTTFGYRSRLSHWSSFLERAGGELDRRGRPASKILVGLHQ